MIQIFIQSCKNKKLIRNHCAYSTIGRICDRFPQDYKLLLLLFAKYGFKKKLIITEISKQNKKMVPLVLVLFLYLKKVNISELIYLFEQNMYLDKYIKKIFLNQKLNKKDNLIKKYIANQFIVTKYDKNQLSKVRYLVSKIILEINKLYAIKNEFSINFIFLKSIKGISTGYGNYNFEIIETNEFPELIIIHELVHNLNYNSPGFKKINTTINCFEFNESFTNVLAQVLYCKYKKIPIEFSTYYYQTRKGKKIENLIRLNYLNWEKEGCYEKYIDYLLNKVIKK